MQAKSERFDRKKEKLKECLHTCVDKLQCYHSCCKRHIKGGQTPAAGSNGSSRRGDPPRVKRSRERSFVPPSSGPPSISSLDRGYPELPAAEGEGVGVDLDLLTPVADFALEAHEADPLFGGEAAQADPGDGTVAKFRKILQEVSDRQQTSTPF